MLTIFIFINKYKFFNTMHLLYQRIQICIIRIFEIIIVINELIFLFPASFVTCSLYLYSSSMVIAVDRCFTEWLYRKTPKTFFRSVASCSPATLLKWTPSWLFFWDNPEIFGNSYIPENLSPVYLCSFRKLATRKMLQVNNR